MKQSGKRDRGDIMFSLPGGHLRKSLQYLCSATIFGWLFWRLLGRVVGATEYQKGAFVLAIFVVVVLFVLAMISVSCAGYEWWRYRTQRPRPDIEHIDSPSIH